MSKELDIKAVLCTSTASAKIADEVTFLAVVRPGPDEETFSLSLRNGLQWINMKVADVIDAREHDVVECDGARCKVVSLRMRRPREAGVWFDLFSDANSSLPECAAAQRTTCSCTGEKSPGPVYRMQNPPPTQAPKDCWHCKLIAGRWWCIEWCW